MNTQNTRTSPSSERGAALVELSFAITFLMIVIFGVIDLGRWLNVYLTASRLAYETARFTSGEVGLPVTGTSWTKDAPRSLKMNIDGSLAEASTVPGTLQTRIQRMLVQHALASIDVSGPVIFRYSLVNDTTVKAVDESSSAATRIIQISVEIPFQSWSTRIFSSSRVRSSARIASLF